MKRLTAIASFLLVMLLWGCGGSLPRQAGDAVEFSPAEQKRLGALTEPYVIQLLGGPYRAPQLQADLERAGSLSAAADSYRLQIADHSRPGLYLLPGRRVIVTRGLLTRLQSAQRVVQAIDRALAVTAGSSLAGPADRDLVAAARALLGDVNQRPPLSPVYPPVVLARALVKRGSPVAFSHQDSPADRPPEWPFLAETQPGYALLEKAERLEAEGKIRPAIRLYLQAGVAAPDEASIHSGLGMAYLRAGDRQSARIHLQEAVELQPDIYRTRMGLGYLALQEKRYGQALRQLQESVRLLPTVENLYLLAEVHAARGEADQARTLYEQIVAAGGGGKLVDAARDRLQEWNRKP